jgi:transcriptional regulator with XRE-family HTH domain
MVYTADGPPDPQVSVRFGARLRSVRRQQHLSLHDVEVASNLEFKGSVLGAYERGERAISVPRLQHLAALYRVPVAELISRRAGGTIADRSSGDDRSRRPPPTRGLPRHAAQPLPTRHRG